MGCLFWCGSDVKFCTLQFEVLLASADEWNEGNVEIAHLTLYGNLAFYAYVGGDETVVELHEGLLVCRKWRIFGVEQCYGVVVESVVGLKGHDFGVVWRERVDAHFRPVEGGEFVCGVSTEPKCNAAQQNQKEVFLHSFVFCSPIVVGLLLSAVVAAFWVI